MGSTNKNGKVQQYHKKKQKAQLDLMDHLQNEFLKANAGNIVQHSDRQYMITQSGAWKRMTERCDIIRNSKDYQK